MDDLKKIIGLAAVLALLGASVGPAAQGQAGGQKETFTGRVIFVAAGPASGQTARVTMRIDRWTTDDERTALVQALQEGGSEALLKALRKTTVGYISSNNSLRYPLNMATSVQTEKGRRIRLVTERPILWAELFGKVPPRTRDYEFGVIEFTLDEKGLGEGIAIPTAKIGLDKDGQIVVETLGTGPQKLVNVKKG